MAKIIRRETVAIVLLPALYLYIMKLPEEYFFWLVMVINILAVMEFCGFYNIPQILAIETVFFSGVYLYTNFQGQNNLFIVTLGMTLTLLLTRLFFVKKGPTNAMKDIGPAIVGFFYITFLLQFALGIRAKGPEWIIYLFATVWGADSAAYYIGKNFGKRKLYPSVSPKKTIEGAFGSLAGGTLASLIMMSLLVETSIEKALLGGLFIGLISMLGDLTESMFKRDAGIKDSSGLIPAHGGVLDKIDGILFCCPLVYYLFCT